MHVILFIKQILFHVLIKFGIPVYMSELGSRYVFSELLHIHSGLFLVQVRFGTKVLRTTSLTRPGFEPPDHDSTLHVAETPTLTTLPSVTSYKEMYCHIILDLCLSKLKYYWKVLLFFYIIHCLKSFNSSLTL